MWTRRALNCASAVTAVSHYTANLVRKDMPTSIPIQVIYNGIDTNHFSPPPIQRNNQKEIRVFFSGNLTLRKGAKWLPAIAGKLQPNIRIYYTLGLRTRNRITKEGPLTSVGSVSLQDMPQRYREMDILLMPTVREGFGLSIAEAMSCGLPVVASDCSAIPELVDDGLGGFLCPVGDVDSFAQKINLLANSPQLRKEMGEYNRAKVEKLFTVERMVAEYQRLFDRVAESK
jgi:glycosyltransferase involved in cell wall biosynthesis